MTVASPGSADRRRRPGAAAVCAAVTAAGLLGALTALPAQAASGQLSISFAQTIGNASLGGSLAGSLDLDTVTSGGGQLSRVAGPDGSTSAVRTPAYDGSASGPRAILAVESTGGDVLSPGTGDLLLRADVSLDGTSYGASSTDNGDNLLQRGLYGTSQYKLQVDHHVPSCRVSGSSGAVSVDAPDAVTPGDWYRLACARNGSTLTLTVKHYVDGAWRKQSTTRASGDIGSVSFAARVPLSVGGKLNDDDTVVTSASDQLNGRYGNILVRIG